MYKKIEVIIFGIRDEPSSSACDCCSGGCIGILGLKSKNKMGHEFDELKSYIEMKKNYENVELKFIDVQKDSYEEHDDAVNMLNQHMKLPYTKINGQMTYYGSLSKEFICEDIEDILLKR
ncbi:MAG: hypothetical protein CVV02_04660 [Firmicutes bacterium HGW-Firmicutes-7]|nr:MAG: hypothetical protein CVV02_04660 [Firmicutes bacterium HGW-Firmicutes-7]